MTGLGPGSRRRSLVLEESESRVEEGDRGRGAEGESPGRRRGSRGGSHRWRCSSFPRRRPERVDAAGDGAPAPARGPTRVTRRTLRHTADGGPGVPADGPHVGRRGRRPQGRDTGRGREGLEVLGPVGLSPSPRTGGWISVVRSPDLGTLDFRTLPTLNPRRKRTSH